MLVKKIIISTFLLMPLLFVGCMQNDIQKEQVNPDNYNFIIANDLGRNGFYDQKKIAASMGKLAEESDIHFVVAAGDLHHFNGVASVNDPLWMTNFELIYNDPNLMLDWYSLLGNHEYRGNTQACLDYGKVSRRWVMPSRYYTMVKEIDEKTSLRLVFIDTTPLVDKYRKDSIDYPDAYLQDDKAQLRYIDSVLSVSKETWKVVIGHHPVYAYTTKSEDERKNMQARVEPLLKKYDVDFYFCGHIHNFQHIKREDSSVEYIVNSSASLSRPVEKTEGTQFCSNLSGFTICSIDSATFTVFLKDRYGKTIYSYTKDK